MHRITLNFKGVDLDVEYEWQEFEPPTKTYPGCPAGVDEVISIKIIGFDKELFDFFDQTWDFCIWEEFNSKIATAHKDRERYQQDKLDALQEDGRRIFGGV